MTEETIIENEAPAITNYNQNPVAATQVADRWIKLSGIGTLPEVHRERLLALDARHIFDFLTAFPEVALALIADPDLALDDAVTLDLVEAIRATAQACFGSGLAGKSNRWAELLAWASGATDVIPEVADEYAVAEPVE